ncbi:hypothetical protein LUZ62_042237 [Rhynchospora pubera]|uniref:NADH dehydrogenase (Ubiquinone) complex I, assembly factor 6 n=1 Tax=Rhynchospora pubera TaxID=906938 RepID=A0AAV8FJN0_9POAL|nr:hypothetical protein LUZ62_042237 [Rhynchospora pubera]
MNGGSSKSLKAAFSYCVQQVRAYDYHHYLCLLHLPHSSRKAAFALRAFNIETSRAMDLASDPKTGLMRLLWWQEALNRIHAGKLVEHPVAQSLSWVISNHRISKHWLKRSLDARITDANRDEGSIPGSISELEKYAEDTQSTLLYLTLQATGVQSTVADHAASHVGKASGLVLLLKSIPHHLNRYGKVLYLPADVADKHGLLMKEGERSEIRVGTSEMGPGGGLADAVFEVASVASAHLRKARQLSGTVPGDANQVLLPAVPAQVALDELEKRRFDVFDSRLSKGVHGVSPLWYQLKLAWYAWRNKY